MAVSTWAAVFMRRSTIKRQKVMDAINAILVTWLEENQ